MIRFAPVDFCRIHVHLFFFRKLLLLHFQFIQLRAKIIRTVNNVLTCLQYHFPKGKLRRLKIILYHKSLQFLKRSRPQRKTKSIKKKFILMAEPKNRSLKSDWERDFRNLNIWILMSLKSIQYGFHYVILWRRCGKANLFLWISNSTFPPRFKSRYYRKKECVDGRCNLRKGQMEFTSCLFKWILMIFHNNFSLTVREKNTLCSLWVCPLKFSRPDR